MSIDEFLTIDFYWFGSSTIIYSVDCFYRFGATQQAYPDTTDVFDSLWHCFEVEIITVI